ncbi:hypothetical protein [Amycolatopsis tolypomycina]|uniref:hypothetical protein n=1 Tax=Amycolatopsis tolypomycina TaxID=208445 RepID=UPI0033A32347
MTSEERTQHPTDPAEGARGDDPHGDTPEAQRETLRGEQGTSPRNWSKPSTRPGW